MGGVDVAAGEGGWGDLDCGVCGDRIVVNAGGMIAKVGWMSQLEKVGQCGVIWIVCV